RAGGVTALCRARAAKEKTMSFPFWLGSCLSRPDMFGAIKKIFKKKEKSATPFQAPSTAPAASGRAPAPAAASTSGGAGAGGETLEWPFRAILNALPTELHGQLAPTG